MLTEVRLLEIEKGQGTAQELLALTHAYRWLMELSKSAANPDTDGNDFLNELAMDLAEWTGEPPKPPVAHAAVTPLSFTSSYYLPWKLG